MLLWAELSFWITNEQVMKENWNDVADFFVNPPTVLENASLTRRNGCARRKTRRFRRTVLTSTPRHSKMSTSAQPSSCQKTTQKDRTGSIFNDILLLPRIRGGLTMLLMCQALPKKRRSLLPRFPVEGVMVCRGFMP